jgi:TetR/AcrR family acrAB operon transcriptional repressor
MRRTKEDAEITRKAILKAALRAFSDNGYAAARLEDIAAEAQCTRGAVYWHFKNKEGLYIKLMEESIARYKDRVKRALDIDGSPLEKIRKLMVELFIMLEDDEEYRLTYSTFLFRDAATEEMMRQIEHVQAFMETVTSSLSTLIRKGIKAGELDPATKPSVAAVALTSYINGIEFTWLSNPDAFSPKKMAAGLADTILKGIIADKG